MSAPARVCWVVLNDLHGSVIPSQVLAPLRAYSAARPDVEFRLALVEAARRAVTPAALARLWRLRQAWPGGRVELVPFVGRSGRAAPGRALLRRAGRWLRGGGLRVIHCRGPSAVLAMRDAATATGARLVFDARGSAALESAWEKREAGLSAADPRTLDAAIRGRELDAAAWRAADAVSAVSAALLDRLREDAGEPAGARPCAVIPPCVTPAMAVDGAREAVRRRLGIADDETLLVHVSTAPQWERYDRVVELLRALHSVRPARLLFVTTVPAERVLASLSPADPLRRRVEVRRARPGEVAPLLSAADVGVLARDRHPAFDVTVPLKVIEYLAAGLVVAATPGEAEVDARLASEGVLHPLPPEGELAAAAASLAERLARVDAAVTRERARALVRGAFTWEAQVPALLRLYAAGAG